MWKISLTCKNNWCNKRINKKKENSIDGEIKEEVTLHLTNAQCTAESLF